MSDVLWCIFLCSYNIHVVFYDVFCNVQVVYTCHVLWYFMRCLCSIHLMIYWHIYDIHVLYIWCYIMFLYVYMVYMWCSRYIFGVHIVCIWCSRSIQHCCTIYFVMFTLYIWDVLWCNFWYTISFLFIFTFVFYFSYIPWYMVYTWCLCSIHVTLSHARHGCWTPMARAGRKRPIRRAPPP